jgi:hypothetical protein
MDISEKLIDKRVVARNIKKGLIDSDAYQQHLAQLPDREENVFRPEEEEVEEEQASGLQPGNASSEIQTAEPMAVQTTSPEPVQPSIEPPPAMSAETQPDTAHDAPPEAVAPAPSFGASETSSNQPESPPDDYKPSIDND